MKRSIVDYAKLTDEILSLLVEKFPDGYEDSDIIRFKNAQNELIEAVEVRTEDTIYLVKVSKKLATRIENFEDDEDDVIVDVEPIPAKGINLEDELEDDEEEDEDKPRRDLDEDEDEDEDDVEDIEDSNEEDEDDDY